MKVMPVQDFRELARFRPAFEKQGFIAGRMTELRETEPGVFAMPHVNYDELVDEFVRSAYDCGWVLRDFDWPTWKYSAEAIALRDDQGAIARATPEQLARLLTVVIRQDRFAEGELLNAFDSGLILRIVRRAEAILETGEEPHD